MSSITETVRDKYAAVALSGLSNNDTAVKSVAAAFGYSIEELASLPSEANMGLSCGNPVAMAALKLGEVVVDLGCGGGLDVLLASRLVGPTGKAIGVDMTTEMLERSRAGAAKAGATNVEFYQAQIDHLPLPDASVDCVLSNCVINLAADKSAVFREMLRVLKPGGRISISDIALKQPLPPDVASSLHAYVGCIARVMMISEYERLLNKAGFEAVIVTDTGADLNVYAQASSSGCCSPESDASCCAPASGTSDASSATAETGGSGSPVHDGLEQIMRQFDVNAYAASVRVYATRGAHSVTLPHYETPVSGILYCSSMISSTKVTAMKTILIYDRPMCCSTGICGPSVDPVLPRFAADLDAMKQAGHTVERYNLSQQPQAFIENKEIHALISSKGTDVLPVVVVDGRVVSRGIYPSMEMLQMWTAGGVTAAAAPVMTMSLPIADEGCCSGSTGCC
jgi:SAM-dependent methyltransferase